MKYFYELVVSEPETGETIARIEAYSQESLQEQLSKVDKAIEGFEEKQIDYAKDNQAEVEEAEIVG